MKRFNWRHLLLSGLLAGLVMNTSNGQEAPPDNSTVVHSQISPHAPAGCGVAYQVHYDRAYKTLREAEDFRPGGERHYYVSEMNDNRNEYLLAGISPNFRQHWLDSHHTQANEAHCIVPLFDEIGAAAKRTLKNYRPTAYKFHDSSEESLIKDAVKKQIADAVILGAGLKQASWDFDKFGNGVPKDRYKYGMAWVKSATFDDGFCRIVHVNIIQDYSGGGTYGESKGRYINMVPAGCK
jgi:hypothetical protein